MDFHWAISWLDGGGPSSCWCCSDDRSASVIFGRGDGAAIGSSCMQKPSSASSESARDGSSSTSAGSASSPANAVAATPPPPLNVRSSDRTNRLEFLRCWSIVRPVHRVRARTAMAVLHGNGARSPRRGCFCPDFWRADEHGDRLVVTRRRQYRDRGAGDRSQRQRTRCWAALSVSVVRWSRRRRRWWWWWRRRRQW